MKNEKISIDVVKMSHHGSSRSISKRFWIVLMQKYLWSVVMELR